MYSKKIFLSFILFLMTASVFAADTLAVALQAQIIQENFSLNAGSIKAASVIMENGQYKGLHIQLKANAAKLFSRMIGTNVGKILQLILEDHIITTSPLRSTLGGDFVITGIGLQDAQLFINKLKAEQAHKEPAKQPFVLDVGKESM